MKQKAFFNIFKGFSLKEIKTTFFEGERPTLKEIFKEALVFVKFLDFYF